MKKYLFIAAALSAAATIGSAATSALLTDGDPIIAVGGHWVCNSDYPVNEYPVLALDQNPASKYLNRGGIYTGLIFTPYNVETSTVRCIQFTTANDSEGRDPANFILWGTNDEIVSEDNSFGDGESWTEIARGDLALPSERNTLSGYYPIANETAYKSYRLVFPGVKDLSSGGGLMQIADIQFFEVTEPNPDEGDVGFLSAWDTAIAIQEAGVATDSNYATSDWDGSKPSNAIDKNLTTRYANYAITDIGLAVTPSIGLSTVESFTIMTFTNNPAYDPTSYSLFGTTDVVTSANNSMGTNENWTLIKTGTINPPTARSTVSDPVAIDATESFTSYKILFNSIRNNDPADVNTVVHLAELQFYGIAHEVPIGDPLLTGGDLAIPFHPTKDMIYGYSASDYPAAENPPKVLDGDTATKYLNRGGQNSGFIVTPAAGSSTVQSLKMWTANDAEGRDPINFALYGTNDEITSENNSYGDQENWIEIATGETGLATDRFSEGPLVAIANSVAYTSYKLVFTELRDNGQGLMQVADVQFYSDNAGSSSILSVDDAIIAIDTNVNWGIHMTQGESTQHAIDRNSDTKYFNGCGAGSGVIFVPVNAKTIAKGIELTTGGDSDKYPSRNPSSYAVYGTNEKVVSKDFGHGDGEAWTLIAENECVLPAASKAKVTIEFPTENTVAYSAYKVMFPTLQDDGTALQLAEIQLLGTVVEVAPVNLLATTAVDKFLAVCGTLRKSSTHNAGESASMGFDQDTATKYLNGGNYTNNLGFIVTPKVGAKSISIIEFWTANDAEGRDPTSYKLYGTNEEVTDEDNGDGSNETWTLVAEGTLDFPAERNVYACQISLDTPTPAFTSWKMTFPTIKGNGETAMQFADVQFTDPEGMPILSAEDEEGVRNLDTGIAIGDLMFGSSYPAQEGPFAIADGNIKIKYLNFGGFDSGFIVTPDDNTTPVNAIRLTAANDSQERDPISFVLYGTDEAITTPQNGSGNEQNWTEIASGDLNLEYGGDVYFWSFRFRNYDLVTFENETIYKSYKLIFPELRGTGAYMQVAEVAFLNVEVEPPAPVVPVYTWTYVNGELKIAWAVSANATLEKAPTALGPWTSETSTLEEGVNVYKTAPAEGSAYYRLVVK